MNFFLLYRTDEQTFKEDEINLAFEDINGAKSVEGSIATLNFTYSYMNDHAIARLNEARDAISISGTGEASVELAWQLQSRIEHPLCMTDSNASFLLHTRDCRDRAAFKAEIDGTRGK